MLIREAKLENEGWDGNASDDDCTDDGSLMTYETGEVGTTDALDKLKLTNTNACMNGGARVPTSSGECVSADASSQARQ